MNRKFWISGVSALALMAGVATTEAADLAVKAPPAPLPVANFAGWYVSGLAGVGSSTSVCNTQFGQRVSDSPSTSFDHGACNGYTDFAGTLSAVAKDTKAVAGVEVGYNWQRRFFVYGLVADWTWTNLKARATGGSGSFAYQGKIEWLASFRGTMGLAVDDTHVYVTGGVAAAGIRDTTMLDCCSSPSTRQDSFRNTYVGWVGGVGAQHQFTREWWIKLEYLHYDLGKRKEHSLVTDTFFEFAHTVDVVRLGLSYRFWSY